MPSERENNPAQVRGDIQRGLTGDKKRGFDPAAAPLETDSEAGGAPLTAEEAQIDRAEQLRNRPADRSLEYGDAMRPFADLMGRKTTAHRSRTLLVLGAIVAAAILVYAIAVSWQ
ncbi:hypothetical protein PYH37_002299 [Sinorhizobium numidicum]|uniref:Transmembrane protein n=1 Tax=Sinorhizobium numidicum TaxID=680248 RepID=A0ABY8D365_9HYPH|nr:hypothetical protein [Sinorhizobium numidicum]WEX77498.1 hypothetical protein PYH37_002299 [Sinorhizobium numidicum]WEX84158.1 hypothetical protein PYH38_003012 [Sinorhizobium numidicum]